MPYGTVESEAKPLSGTPSAVSHVLGWPNDPLFQELLAEWRTVGTP